MKVMPAEYSFHAIGSPNLGLPKRLYGPPICQGLLVSTSLISSASATAAPHLRRSCFYVKSSAQASPVATSSHSFSFRRLDLTRWLAKPMQLGLTVSFRQNACHEVFGHARSAGPDSVRLRYRKAFLPHDQYHGGFERCFCHVSCAQWS